MGNVNFDAKKAIEEMEALREKILEERKALNLENGEEVSDEDILKQITVKYLGQMELPAEKETGKTELKNVYITLEDVDGHMQIRYYDADQRLLGEQSTDGREIILGSDIASKSMKEQIEVLKQLGEADKDNAKTKEELEEQIEREENTEKEEAETLEEVEEQEGKENDGEEQSAEAASGPQLTPEEVRKLKGPKIDLDDQKVDGDTLGDVIGLEGQYMQIVTADVARRLGVQVPTSQKTVPIEIFADGSANLIGEDKLSYSTIEGGSSAEEHFTKNNDGTVAMEQTEETFNIVKKGGMHTIAVGYDENGGMPLEAKYGRRDPSNPTKIDYTEIKTVNEGPLQQADSTQQYQNMAGGIYQGADTIEAMAKKYAVAMNIQTLDGYGYPTGEYDLQKAKQLLEQKLSQNPGATLDELIDGGTKQVGPQEDKRG